ncbi:MAG: PEGA domain-containing protein [Fibrobacter sp.]|nr:PEGA domain-containing protein [Fibrobacter sp.]
MRLPIVIFFLVSFVASLYAETFVAILETSSDVLQPNERIFVTDKIRAEARKALPSDFTIMTRENIVAMLPPGKSIEDCEGSCLVETGKNIAADYVAHARVTEVGGKLSVTLELYSTMNNNLVNSFSERAVNLDEMLAILEQQINTLFKELAFSTQFSGGVVRNARKGSTYSVSEDGFQMMLLNSTPTDAAVSIDGKPVPGCSQTPCKVEILTGRHRIILAKENYLNSDTIVEIANRPYKLHVSLQENFGRFFLRPQYNAKGKTLTVLIDGRAAKEGENLLEPGKHLVEISHPCYETETLTVGIERNRSERFTEKLDPRIGGLSLRAMNNTEPVVLPVYINGAQVGTTPYLGQVRLCDDVAVENPTTILNDLKLKYHETVEYMYQKKTNPPETAVSAAWDESDYAENFSHGNGKMPAWAKMIPYMLAAAMISLGIYENSILEKEKDEYEHLYSTSAQDYDHQWDKAENAQLMRNIFYGAGMGFLTLGLTVSILF